MRILTHQVRTAYSQGGRPPETVTVTRNTGDLPRIEGASCSVQTSTRAAASPNGGGGVPSSCSLWPYWPYWLARLRRRGSWPASRLGQLLERRPASARPTQ